MWRGGQGRLQGGAILEKRPKIYMESSRQRGQRAFCQRRVENKGKGLCALSVGVGEIAWSQGI